jgi:2OG-Fe(II) oxygenase superfamily
VSIFSDYENQGCTLIPEELVPLTGAQWQSLMRLCQAVNYEKVVGGDTGDAHSVWVGRFINDVNLPRQYSDCTPAMLEILMSPAMQRWYSDCTGLSEPLCLRRCQANKMQPGDFIGYHIDRDTTPDYDATFIFHLSQDYQGGNFVAHHPQLGSISYTTHNHQVMLNRSDIPHEVLPVTQGTRLSLACFLSRNFGPSQKPRLQIQTEQLTHA